MKGSKSFRRPILDNPLQFVTADDSDNQAVAKVYVGASRLIMVRGISMSYLAYVTASTIAKVLEKHHVATLDARELAKRIIIKRGLSDARVYLTDLTDGSMATAICDDISKLDQGKWENGRWMPDVLSELDNQGTKR